jgi:hypothetical protein
MTSAEVRIELAADRMTSSSQAASGSSAGIAIPDSASMVDTAAVNTSPVAASSPSRYQDRFALSVPPLLGSPSHRIRRASVSRWSVARRASRAGVA